MRILVAGGAGYIGSALVPRLLERGHDVGVIDALWFGSHLPPQVPLIAKDLFDCTVDDLRGYNQVIFLAGLSNDPMAEHSPARNFTTNAALPSFLAYLAREAHVRRFIYASSCSVYGYTEGQLYNEDSPVVCRYPYGISKLQGERGVLQLGDEHLSVIALRQGTVCGHSPRMRFDLIVNTMYRTAMTAGRITVHNAAIWRPVLDLRDAVDAYELAIAAERGVHGVFNVASSNHTVGEVGALVAAEIEALTGVDIAIAAQAMPDPRNYRVATERARAVLGFQPRRTVADIVRDLHEHRASYGDYDKDEYYNIRVFRALGAVGKLAHP